MQGPPDQVATAQFDFSKFAQVPWPCSGRVPDGEARRAGLVRTCPAMRWPLLALVALTACRADAEPEETAWHLGTGPKVQVTGKAFVFGPSGGSLVGATVSVAEAPEIKTTVGTDGTFALSVPSGGEASFVVSQPGFHDTQSATFLLGAGGLDQVGFQVPTDGIFDFFSRLVKMEPDPELCQIVSTVSRAGTAPYGGDALGEPGVIVALEPPIGPDHGPVYFNWIKPDVILPDPTLKVTTIDGGVIFTNVPPGEYQMTATKTGKRFTSVKLRCRKGLLVNAAPPRGLQEI